MKRELESESPNPSLLTLPATNPIHIDVERLTETLKLYEADFRGFFDQIPRLR
ncbi:MAG: hypothetical protein HY558_05385 [Euryarchaeota archaeon]|nr:hypothetical protein [Euryarchaeota archaeon]